MGYVDSTLKALFRAIRDVPIVRGVVRRLLPEVEATIRGDRYRLSPRDNHTERKMWLTGAPAEPESLAALEATLRGKRVLFVDIGANCGVYTIRAAKTAAPGSKIIAVEPNPRMVARLQRNLGLNGLSDLVEVAECAVAAEESQAELILTGDFGRSSLRQGSREKGRIVVPTRPLGALLPKDRDAALFVVKIDVEGFEDEALHPYLTAPGSRLPDVVLIETAHAKEWRRDLLGAFADRGYVSTFEGEGNTLLQRSE